MANKNVKDIDDLVWRRFVAYCKIKDVLVGEELTRILGKVVVEDGS